MAPRLDYYFRETATGLRRNGVVAFAAMSTSFIALFLVGLALLIAREFNVAINALTGNVQVAVYMENPVQPDNLTRIEKKLEALPAVASVTYWDTTTTCNHFRELFSPVFTENVDCAKVIPTSLRVKLANTSEFAQITAALGCSADATSGTVSCKEPGVKNVADYSQLLDKLSTLTRVLSVGILSVAVIMLASAVALVANTLRMGMFARRKEIGIMRLVGATNWRIRVPFLVEGLVESLAGGLAAVVALFLVKVIFIDRLRSHFQLFPLIKNSDVLAVAPWILLAAFVVAVIAGTVGMRKFLDV